MKYIILALLLSASNTYAGDLLIGQFSHHFTECDTWDCPYISEYSYTHDDDPECNSNCTGYIANYREVHPLIGYTNGKYTAFIMKNSYNRTSAVLLRNYTTEWGDYIRPALSIGLASGYQKIYHKAPHIGPLNLAGVVSFDIHPKSDKFGLVVSILPTQWVSFGFRYKLN